MKAIVTTFFALCLLVSAACLPEYERQKMNRDTDSADTLPPPRDGEVAVREEYEIAVSKGSIEALELFIARHPESQLAEQARTRIRLLTGTEDSSEMQ